MFGRKKSSEPTPQEVEVFGSLRCVRDPYLQEDLVELDYVRNCSINEGKVKLELVLPSPSESYQRDLRTRIQEVIKGIPWVKDFQLDFRVEIPSSLPKNAMENLRGIKNLVAISSGKGGVGKSTVSVNLAMALAKLGAKVGLMDADVYGPSVPKMLASKDSPTGQGEKLFPIERYGIKFMSMGLLTGEDSPVIWRGPMATKLIQTFLAQVEWGELDYLLIDLPPGTGDVQLTLTQTAPLTGAVVVTTPQEVAVNVTMRGLKMFDEVNVPILGVVENMSGFVCPHCNEETQIFKQGGGERTANELMLRFLGRIPIDPKLVQAGDEGNPVLNLEGDNLPSSAGAFSSVADELASQIAMVARHSKEKEVIEKIGFENGQIVMVWKDHMETRIAPRDLRLACPCAECVDEWTGAKILEEKKVPLDVHPRSFKMIGRYAVQIAWSDGHSSGIYTFDLLERSFRKETPKGAELPSLNA